MSNVLRIEKNGEHLNLRFNLSKEPAKNLVVILGLLEVARSQIYKMLPEEGGDLYE